MSEMIRELACKICGHVYDGDTGDIIKEKKDIIVPEKDRGPGFCFPCHLLQEGRRK